MADEKGWDGKPETLANGTAFAENLFPRVSDVAVFNILRPDPRNIKLFRRFLR